MEQFAIYLWSISVNIHNLLSNVGGVFVTLGGFTLGLMYLLCTVGIKEMRDNSAEDLVFFTKWFNMNKFFLSVGIPLVLFANLIPSQRDLALIFTYPYIKSGVIKAVQSPQMKKMNDVSLLYLDKITKDLQKEIKK